MLKGLDAKKITEEVGRLKGERANFETVWQEVGHWLLPRKNDIQQVSTPGEAKYNNILDSTGMNSLELLAGALHGMLTNPSGYFFNLTTGKPELDELDEVRLWIQKTVRAMHYRLNNSNFQTEVQELYLDLCGFGMGIMSMEEDEEEVVRFNSRAIQECYVKENSKKRIDCLYRCYRADGSTLIEDFGIDNVPEKVQVDYKSGKSCKYEIIHAVYPASRVKLAGPVKKAFGYISQYIFVDTKETIEVITTKQAFKTVVRV
jgi:hypothetical protein